MDSSIKVEISRDVYTQEQLDKEFLLENPQYSSWELFKSYLPKLDKSYAISTLHIWVPCTKWIPKYRLNFILPDLLAGITVAIMNVPQAMAYGHLANLPPVIGLYTSFLPALLYAFLGTCMHTSLGMFAIAALMVGNVVTREMSNQNVGADSMDNMHLSDRPDVQLVVTLTFLVGLVMIAMALLQIHVLASYLSDSLISGFTTAAAIHVLLSQIPPLLGLEGLRERSGFIKLYYTLYDIFSHISHTNLAVLVLSAVCVVLLYIGKNYMNPQVKKLCFLPVPLELIAVVITTLLSHFIKFETRYKMDVVGNIPTGFPKPITPKFSKMPHLLPDAAIIALVIYVVSFSVGKLFGKNHKYKVDASQELRVLALCQIVPSFFLCHPSSVSLSRSQVVAQSGSKSPVAIIISALIMLCVILWAGPLLEALPMAVLSSIVVVALQGMLRQWKESVVLWKCSKYDCITWIFSFFITIIWDVSEGLIASFAFIIVTVVLRFQWSNIKFLGRIGNTELYRNTARYSCVSSQKSLLVINFDAPLLFFNCDRFKENILHEISSFNELSCLIMDASGIVTIDKAGAGVLKELYDELQSGYETRLIVAAASEDFQETCSKCGILKKISSNFFFPTIQDAVLYVTHELKMKEYEERNNENDISCISVQL